MRILVLYASLALTLSAQTPAPPADPATSAPAPAEPQAPPKAHPLDGVWKLTAAIAHGQEVPATKFTGVSRSFHQGSLILMNYGKPYFRGQYRTFDDRDPKQIDITFLDGPNKGRTLHGIYEISGDVLRVCTGKNGATAPRTFESTPISETILDTFERQK